MTQQTYVTFGLTLSNSNVIFSPRSVKSSFFKIPASIPFPVPQCLMAPSLVFLSLKLAMSTRFNALSKQMAEAWGSTLSTFLGLVPRGTSQPIFKVKVWS